MKPYGKHDKSGVYERRLAKWCIRTAVKHLGGIDYPNRITAKRYIRSEQFSSSCELVGYPEDFLDTLKSLVVLSEAQRHFASLKILRLLNDHWKN